MAPPVEVGDGVELAGRTALVTGASGGIGQAIARALAARGVTMLLSGRRGDVLAALATELGARALPADLADPADVERLAVASAHVDILVANAGVSASGPLASKSAAEVDRALAVNLRAPIVLAQRVLPAMQARGSGHLVFVSSLSGKAGAPGTTLYAATKFGLRGLALSLREDLRGTGIGVSGIYPGFIRDAGMFHDSGAKLPPYVGTKAPQQVAAAVVRAIEHDRAEVDVAPLPLRAGTALAGLAPETVGRVQRRLGGAKVAEAIVRGQRT
jgi:short-subunit dehydrogenase